MGRTRSFPYVYSDVESLKRLLQTWGPTLQAMIAGGSVDDGNSTAQTLPGSGTFAGTWADVTEWSAATIVVSVTGATTSGGLVFEFGTDGSTALHSHSYTLGAGETRHFTVPLLLSWFRVTLADAGAGGAIEIETKLHRTLPGPEAKDDGPFDVGVDRGTPMMGVFSTNTVDADDAGVVAIDGSRNQKVVGTAGDDDTDVDDGVLKVGGVTDDSYDDPTGTTAQPGDTVTVSGNRANVVMNERRELLPAVIGQLFDLSALNVTYDDDPTSVTVSGLYVWPYREFHLGFDLDVTGSPTDIRIEVFTSNDGSNYAKLMNDGMANLVYSPTTIGAGITRSVFFRARAVNMQVVVTAVGTDGAGNDFDVSNATLAAST